MRLTARQREAVEILRACRDYDDGWGIVTGDETSVDAGEPWINWRTAYSLRNRGLAEIDGVGDGMRIRLIEHRRPR